MIASEALVQAMLDGESDDGIEFSPEEVADIVAASMGPEALARYVLTTGDRSHGVDLKTFVKDYTNVGQGYKLHMKIVQAVIKKAIAGLSDGPRYKIWIYTWLLKNTVITWEKTFLLVDVPLHHRSLGNINFQKTLLLLGAQVGIMNKDAEELPGFVERIMKDYTIKS